MFVFVYIVVLLRAHWTQCILSCLMTVQ